jgi:uncharacterized damage-inducible protein DinB
VDKDPRERPEPAADEKAMLSGWLDWQRQTVRLKCADLSDADARRRHLPETSPQMSIAWLVQHLTSVELGWFVRHVIEETARHLGHLDILRELTDGARCY